MSIPSPKLLILDDESALMRALCDTLGAEGYDTTGFTSAAKALSVLREQSFDLLITDLMMPEMDGISLLKAAFEIDPNLAGIVMTGHASVDTAVKALKAGAVDYILKPFKLGAILPVLARALTLRRLRMENIQLREAVGLYELSMAIAFAGDSKSILDKIADAAAVQKQCAPAVGTALGG
jgi:DNA-binding NtrC family response regulator